MKDRLLFSLFILFALLSIYGCANQPALIHNNTSNGTINASLLSTQSVSINQPNKPPIVDGFRGMKWGDAFSELKKTREFIVKEDDGDFKIYSVKGDQLKIGNADLASVVYVFWRGKFYGAIVKTEGLVNFERLKEASFIKFGPGSQANQFMEDYIWPKEQSTVLMLSFKEISGDGVLYLASKELSRQRDVSETGKAIDGAVKDF